MTLWRTIGEILAHWTDTVATGVIALASRFFSPRLVRLVEDDKPDTFALEGAGKAGPATGQLRQRPVQRRGPGELREGQPDRAGVAAEPLPGAAARTAGARQRIHRRHRAGADRPLDAVDRGRGGVRLRHAGHRRLRQDRDHDRGDDARQYRTLHCRPCGAASRLAVDLHAGGRGDARTDQGVRAAGARTARPAAAEPAVAPRAGRRHGGRGAVDRRRRGHAKLSRQPPGRAHGRADRAPHRAAPRPPRRRQFAVCRCWRAASTKRRRA